MALYERRCAVRAFASPMPGSPLRNHASGVMGMGMGMGMRKIARLSLSFTGVLIMGLIWTVGQTGLSDTNAHLCELFSRYFPDISENCQASDWIVRIAGYLFFLAIAITIL